MERFNSSWTGHSDHDEKVAHPKDPHALFGQPFHSTHPHLLQPGEVTPGISTAEFAERRRRLIEALSGRSAWPGGQHVLLLPAARHAHMSEGINHLFRQSSDLLYLSGCQEPEALLLMHTGPRRAPPAHTSVLFLAADTAEHRRWEGGRTGASPLATALYGVDYTLSSSELCVYLENLARELGRFTVWYDFLPEAAAPLNTTVRDLLATCNDSRLESPRLAIHQQRLIKSPAEQRLLKASARVACDALTRAMKTPRPVSEQQLAATIEYHMKARGAQRLAYPAVVASGPRSNIIHYTRNDQRLAPGQHVLVDAGCELHGYCSDVSRCWPVSGLFSAGQRHLYERLLHVQTALLEVVHNTRPTLDSLYACMLRLLSEQLAELGLVGFNRQRSHVFQSVQRYCPHHVGHYLGLDVHDTSLVPKNIKLQPGMCITVEPGIYIDSADSSGPAELRGLGFRIEDDVIITEHGCEVITASCPKSIDDVHAITNQTA